MDITLWLTFFVACWAISLSPGPGALAAMGSGHQYGFRQGFVTIIGLILGIWTQMLVVGVGVGALLATSQWAFAAMKWIGALYLVYLGIQQWRAPALAMKLTTQSIPKRKALIAQAWGINALNPKGTVFLLAVVPQLLDPHQDLITQYVIIGLTLAFTDLVVMSGYMLLAAKVLSALKSESHIRWMNRTFGSLFVMAGALLATYQRASR
jgi:homoserine/homoserine lactone efflux protein